MNRRQYRNAREKIDDFDAIFGDEPDGAYWALAEEHGVDMYFQMEVDEYEQEHNLGVHEHESN